MGPRSRISPLGLVLVATMVFAGTVAAQQTQQRPDPPAPYATINHSRIVYAGPDRANFRDLKGPEVRIGLLVPLEGPRKAEGEAALLATRLALEDLTAQRPPGGQRLALVVGDESGPWGRVSSELVRLVVDADAAAVVTSAEGAVAHLAEQVGNKIGVPVLTLATDSTTTEINMPWIFRLSPDDRAQAQAFARVIYSERGYRKVVLISQRDHDGRAGSTEFEKAVSRLGAPAPERLDLDPNTLDLSETLAAIRLRTPEAVVIWTGARAASRLVPALRQDNVRLPLFLCQKAAAEGVGKGAQGAWTISRLGANAAAGKNFEERFRSRAGSPPTSEAAATYDAVSLVGTALRQSGPNRARLRDQLAKISHFAGISGQVSFDGAGNNTVEIRLSPLAEPSDPVASRPPQ